jgi:transcription antitermination factor NusG
MTTEPKTGLNDLHALYVLCVSGEDRATKQLAEAGVTSWAPTFKKLRLAIGRQPARLIDRPLIPGYVFARLGQNDFAAALATERVHGVISSGGVPKVFPEAEFTKVLMLAISGRFDERLPATKAAPRGVRKRGLAGLNAWFAAVEASQLNPGANTGMHRRGGESVSEGKAPSRRSTTRGRKAKGHRIRKVRSVA